MKRLLLLICCLFMTLGNTLRSQTPDMEATLSYVNETLGSSFQVTVERGVLVVKYFQSGELFRDDQALCKDLDPKKITYDPTVKMGYLSLENSWSIS